MSQNKIWCGALIIVLAFVCVPARTHAASTLSISEIMYDLPGSDSNHEWIEVHNVTGTSITIIGGSASGSWRFNDGSNHFLAETPAKGSMTIAAGGYAVIAADAATFLIDHSGFSGTVIDTSMSLPNTGGTVKVVDDSGNIIDSVEYANTEGASGDGNTLQLAIDESWIAAEPTPGAATTATTSDTTGTDGTTDTTTTTTNTTTTSSGSTGSGGSASGTVKPTTVAYDPFVMKAKLSAPISGVVGIPVTISASVTGYSGQIIHDDPFLFALGDGSQVEEDILKPFPHTYAYPGTYVITFSYRTNYYMTTPDVTTRQTIDITAPSAVVSNVNGDGSIEIKNPGDSEADVSAWSLESKSSIPEKYFKIPLGTIILPGKSITLTSGVTGFSVSDATSIDLLLPSGAVVSSYPSKSIPIAPVLALAHVSSVISPATVSIKSDVSSAAPDSELTATAFPATAAESSGGANNTKTQTVVFLAVGILGVIGVSVLALRHFRLLPIQLLSSAEEPANESKKIADSIRIVEE